MSSSAAKRPSKPRVDIPPLNFSKITGIPVVLDTTPPSPEIAISHRDRESDPPLHNIDPAEVNLTDAGTDLDRALQSLQEVFERCAEEKVMGGHDALKVTEQQFRDFVRVLVSHAIYSDGLASSWYQFAQKASPLFMTWPEFLNTLPNYTVDQHFLLINSGLEAARGFFDPLLKSMPDRLRRKHAREAMTPQLKYIFNQYDKNKTNRITKDQFMKFVIEGVRTPSTTLPRPSPPSSSQASIGLQDRPQDDEMEMLWQRAKHAQPGHFVDSKELSFVEFRNIVCDVNEFCADEHSHDHLLDKINNLAPPSKVYKSRCCNRYNSETGEVESCIIL